MQRLSLWEERMISFPVLAKKQGLINLTVELEKSTVINASGDADVDIVKAARPQNISPLLLYYAGTNNRGLYSKAAKVYKICEMK